MKPVILFRPDRENQNELIDINQFDVVNYRTDIRSDSLVIGRYSVLPFYPELEKDIKNLDSKMLQSYAEHQYIANMDYVQDIGSFTPKTWFRLEDVPEKYRNKPLILKGRTNSRKQQWKTKMYAANFSEAASIAHELLNDPLIGPQGLAIREYRQLATYEYDIIGLPRTCEYRLFFLKDRLLAHGYYWGNIEHVELIKRDYDDFLNRGISFAKNMAKIIAENTTFFVIDIAKTISNEWIVIEINDGQMSGLNSTVDPRALYENLYKELINLDYIKNKNLKFE